MEIEKRGRDFVLDKELNYIDKLVIEFCKILDELKINYVIISGYVAILFGRTRGTEDVDLFIEKISAEKLEEFFGALKKSGFYVINSPNAKDSLEMLSEGLAIRAAKQGSVVPNFEIKFPKKDSDFYSLENKIKITLSGNEFFTSPLETQIAFKLKLGSDKDIEDAVHLFKLLEQYLDRGKLIEFCEDFEVVEKAKKYLGGLY